MNIYEYNLPGGKFSVIFTELLTIKGLKATQSSLGWEGIPVRAIDGNFDTNYGEKSCTRTMKQPANWWMVDLGKSYRVKEVKIYNRADCCKDRLNGATVRVGDNARGMLTNAVCGEPIKVGTSSVIIRECTLKGQYVSVSLKNQYLTLCEVEVFGEELLTIKGLKATQSSLGWEGIPVRAIDGNFDTNYGEKSCTHTMKQPENWWMVDLGKSYRVKEVKIYNRAGMCSRAHYRMFPYTIC
ncbi:fucolectin-5-like [Anneissia japonica]|uniref:fucolectin-5-like n=1 Tax=Anneissia japonica TaxID=1529436 RepID=UPI00142576BD|nr:fucolectin-5-like [Anneissia japonica]